MNRVLSSAEIDRLLASCLSPSPIDLRDRVMIMVGLETGLRKTQLAAMQLEQIRVVPEGFTVIRVSVRDTTTAVPLSDSATLALGPWRKWLRSQGVTKGPVFCGLKREEARGGRPYYTVGGRLSLVGIYKIIERRSRKIGLAGVTPDTLRTTCIIRGHQP